MSHFAIRFFFLATITFTCISNASDLTWVNLTSSANGDYVSFLDTDSIQPFGKGSWAVWVRMVYKEPKRDGVFSPSYVTEQRRYILRCDERTIATTQRNTYNEEGAQVTKEAWPEAKWRFDAIGAKGGTSNIEFASICSLALLPKPLLDFGEKGQWFPLEKTGSSVDTANVQRVGDFYTARVRLVNDENKRINDTYYRSLYSYVIGNCKEGTSGIYAFAFANARGEVVTSGLVPLNEVKMEKVESDKPSGILWSGMCTAPAKSDGGAKTQSVGSGTGFFVSREGYILTNSHVASGCGTLTVRTSDRITTAARLVGEDKKNDLALIQVDKQPKQIASFRQAPVEIGEEVYVFGFPLVQYLSSGGNGTAGIVSATTGFGDDTSKFQMSAPVQPGNSGGPALDRFGAIVGVVVEKLNALAVAKDIGDVPQNINFAIKQSTALAFLDSLGVKYQVAKQTVALSPTVLFSDARSMSVFVECK